MEFTCRKGNCYMAVSFWREDVIQWVELCGQSLTSAFPGNLLGSISRLLSLISSVHNLVSVSGGPSAILQTLFQCGLFKNAVQYTFRFEVLSLPRLIHQKYESFFGKIGFFSKLKYFVVFLNDTFDQPWILKCPDLSIKVFILVFNFLWKIMSEFVSREAFRPFRATYLLLSFASYATIACDLDLRAILCTELVTQ